MAIIHKERRVGNTFAEGQTVNIGGSWIHDRGLWGYLIVTVRINMVCQA